MGILAALTIVAIITAIAVNQSWRSELDLTRSGHRWLGMQASAYAHGAEQLAVIALAKDAKESQVDTLQELWATGFDFPTDHGSMQIRIIDAQGRFNLNSLHEPYNLDANNQPLVGPQKYKPAHRRFLRLLQVIPLSEEGDVLDVGTAELILEAVKDWVDADQAVTGFGGAERDHYSQLDPPLIINDGPMVSVSELLRVKGMTPDLYRGLLPYVASLPPDAPMNAHTMGYVLARTLASPDNLYPLSPEDGQTLYDDILSNELEGIGDIKDMPSASSIFGQTDNGQVDLDTTGLDVSTSWFELDTTVVVGDHIKRSRSLIYRGSNGAQVVRRSDANF